MPYPLPSLPPTRYPLYPLPPTLSTPYPLYPLPPTLSTPYPLSTPTPYPLYPLPSLPLPPTPLPPTPYPLPLPSLPPTPYPLPSLPPTPYTPENFSLIPTVRQIAPVSLFSLPFVLSVQDRNRQQKPGAQGSAWSDGPEWPAAGGVDRWDRCRTHYALTAGQLARTQHSTMDLSINMATSLRASDKWIYTVYRNHSGQILMRKTTGYWVLIGKRSKSSLIRRLNIQYPDYDRVNILDKDEQAKRHHHWPTISYQSYALCHSISYNYITYTSISWRLTPLRH